MCWTESKDMIMMSMKFMGYLCIRLAIHVRGGWKILNMEITRSKDLSRIRESLTANNDTKRDPFHTQEQY